MHSDSHNFDYGIYAYVRDGAAQRRGSLARQSLPAPRSRQIENGDEQGKLCIS